MKDAQPSTTYLKDYQAPDYWIDSTCLTFDLHEDYALVTSVLQIRLNQNKNGKTLRRWFFMVKSWSWSVCTCRG